MTERALVIGETENAPEAYLLNWVVGAFRLRSGEIVVANCGTSEIRLFDRSGKHIRSFGREGSGPGEFRVLTRAFDAGGDTIATFDYRLQRIELVTKDGVVRRTLVSEFGVLPRDRLADGSFIALLMPNRKAGNDQLSPGIHAQSGWVGRLSPAGALIDSLGPLPAGEVLVMPTGVAMAAPYSALRRGLIITVFPDRVVVGSRSGIVEEYAPGFRQIRAMPTVTRPEALTDAKARVYARQISERMEPQARAATYRRIVESSRPDSLPAHDWLKAGVDGTLWVQDGVREDGYRLTWTAYRDGRPVARLALPRMFLPFEFGAGDVLGVEYDDLGVERVVLLKLVPGSMPARNSMSFLEWPPYTTHSICLAGIS